MTSSVHHPFNYICWFFKRTRHIWGKCRYCEMYIHVSAVDKRSPCGCSAAFNRCVKTLAVEVVEVQVCHTDCKRELIKHRIPKVCKCSLLALLSVVVLHSQSAGCHLLWVTTGQLPCLASNCIVVDTTLRFPCFPCCVTQFVGCWGLKWVTLLSEAGLERCCCHCLLPTLHPEARSADRAPSPDCHGYSL